MPFFMQNRRRPALVPAACALLALAGSSAPPALCAQPQGALLLDRALTQRAATAPADAAAPAAPGSGAAPASAAAAAPALRLRASPRLQEQIPQALRERLPVFVRGERISGQTDQNASVLGHAELRRGDTVIRADRLDYDLPQDLARASGQVRINRAGDVYEGRELELHVAASQGFFDAARYRFLATQTHGQAARLEFIDHDRTLVHEGSYTSCERDDSASWQPGWVLRARRLYIDRQQDTATAEGAVLEFLGLALPAPARISFPLSNKRKTGLLAPTLGLDSRDGLSYLQPWYWNIAPNRDATLRAALMTRRGVNLGVGLRYLEPAYSGQLDADWMLADRLRQRARWGFSGQHQGGWNTPIGGLGLNLKLQRVSDDNYWRDFGRAAEPLRQRLLPGDATFNWAQGDATATLRTLKWQTLQDPASPIVPPYDRMPQLQWRYAPTQLGAGLDAQLELDSTRFQAARALTGQPNAQRSHARAQISRPFLAPAGFVTPRLQLHSTQYQFDAPLSDGARTASRSVPTFSLDSGLLFERQTSYLGRDFLQTLEPRAFYTYTPYRDQSRLPVYDTAANDFNFATIYTENAFGGNDRIADNNLLTMGLTTRLLAPDSGADLARFGIAQRLRFSDQRVTLPGASPVREDLSDLLLGAAINWTPQWALDGTVQYNPKTSRSIRNMLAARYSPGSYRTISAAYRLQRGTSEQLDLAWQWPLAALSGSGAGSGGRWYSVGRLNYSLQDRKMVDTVLGLEYDACCWIARAVLERLHSGRSNTTTRLLFQIDLLGLSQLSLGASPLDSFKHNVPHYQSLRTPGAPPGRLSNYD